jgi:superfamily II DNA or RNA helicase
MKREEVKKQIINSLPLQPHGRILTAPRTGKTAIAIELIKRNNPESILWCTPSKELANIGIIQEFHKWNASEYLQNLSTSTYDSLHKIKGYFEMIILDEDQVITENRLKNILNKEITYNYIITLSGTPAKTIEKNIIYQMLKLPVLCRIDINEAVDTKLLSDYNINVIQTRLSQSPITAGKKDHLFTTTEEKNYKWINDKTQEAIQDKMNKRTQFLIMKRRRTIADSPAKEYVARQLIKELKGRKMIFCSSIEQSERICDYVYHSKTSNKNLFDFIDEKIHTLGLVDAGSLGFTYKNIDHLIIVQVDSDNTGKTSQKICRALLKQEGKVPTIWIIELLDTQDTKWVESALSNFDNTKIKRIKYR